MWRHKEEPARLGSVSSRLLIPSWPTCFRSEAHIQPQKHKHNMFVFVDDERSVSVWVWTLIGSNHLSVPREDPSHQLTLREWKQKSCVHVLLSVFWSCWLLVLLTETFLRGNHFHLMLQQVLVWTRYLDSEGSDPVFVLRSSMLLCLSPGSLTVSQFCGLLSSRKLYKLCVTSSSVFSVSVWNSCVSLMFWWDQMFHQ